MSKPEDLSNWYFRLNGFLTIPNFILHPQKPGSQRTDADLVGIRFPFRKEFGGDQIDDPKLCCSSTKPSLFIVEVKTKEVDLNNTWICRPKGNINKLITDLGILEEPKKIAEVSRALYESGQFDGEYYWSFALVGDIDAGKVSDCYESVPRRFWTDICEFIHQRMRTYCRLKTDHSQWDCFGKKLYELAKKYAEEDDFEKQLRLLCGLPAAPSV